jgi:hypothetical protein
MIATHIEQTESNISDFDYQLDYFEFVRKAHKFNSQWSLYEVTDITAPHMLGNIVQVAYDKHWGHRTVFVEVLGNTWLDLYVAADKAISLSGDNHHVFIEAFNTTDVAGQVSLSTGS